MASAEEIRNSVSVPAVLEIFGLEPPERIPGLILCPVHETEGSTPSLNVDEMVWYCHGCGKGGGAIDFVMFVGGTSFRQACQFLEGSIDELVEMPQVERKPEKPLLDLTYEYGKVRDANDREWDNFREWCELKWPQWPNMDLRIFLDEGWATLGDHNLWIPHKDNAGVVRGIKLRVMERPTVGKKNAITDSNFSQRLYRVLERPFAPLAYLVEGETDTWTLSMHFLDRPGVAVYGMPSGVATWKPWFADEVNRHGACVVVFDDDESGRRGFSKVAKTLEYCVSQKLPAGANDVTEAFSQGWRI